MQYLLGQAPPEDLSSFEERMVTDGEFYDELVIAEDELIDQYLTGELSESERESFENYFLLEPERQRKLRFGRAFKKLLDTVELAPDASPVSESASDGTLDVPKPPPKSEDDIHLPSPAPSPRPWYAIFLPSQNPVFAYSFIVAVVLIIAGASWLALRNRSTQEPGTVYAVVLPSGITRGGPGGGRKITVPPGAGTVELRPELRRDEYVSYRAVLSGDEGTEVWRADNLKSKNESGSGSFISVSVPTRLLPPGYYSLKVAGLSADGKSEDLPSYGFQVIR